MAHPHPPSDPHSLSAAELRRRLLASTPPPMASAAAERLADPADEEPAPAPAPVAAVAWGGGTSDLLARLRMPGKSGSVPVPPVRGAAAPPSFPALPPLPSEAPRTTAGRRTPSPGGPRSYSSDPGSAIAGALNQLADLSPGGDRYEGTPTSENQRLRAENNELRTLLDEMKHLLQEASNTEQQLTVREKGLEATIAEKDAQLAELSAQLGGIEEQIATGQLAPPPPAAKTRTELEEWGDELERESAKITQEKKRVLDERQQLREDEEALEQQMRQMEVSMARERAMIARQETELKRLSAEIQHELDLLQRGDAGLRDQMKHFQRRAQEVLAKPGGPPPVGRR